MTPSGKSAMSGISDTGHQLGIDDCIASARADTVAEALGDVEEARRRYELMCQERHTAEAELWDRIYKAGRAGATVRATATAAGMGKTSAHEIMRYGQRGWA